MLKQIKNRIVSESSESVWSEIRSDLADELFIFLVDSDLQPFLEKLEENLTSYNLTNTILTDLSTTKPVLELPSDTVGSGIIDDSSIIPENGWILKYKNGGYSPCQKVTIIKDLEKEDLLINTQTTFKDYINTFVNIQRTGYFKVTVSYNYSSDATSRSIVSRLTIDDKPITFIKNNEIMRVEVKDSNGNDSDGRGTDQKLNFCQSYYFNFESIGNKNINLTFAPSSNNIEAAIWNCSIELEECF